MEESTSGSEESEGNKTLLLRILTPIKRPRPEEEGERQEAPGIHIFL